MANNRPQSDQAPAGRVTMSAVAREASVSVSTVSKVLNGRPGVSAEVRRQVESLLEKRAYARRGAVARSACIHVVFGALDTDWTLEILQGIEIETTRRGLSIVLTPSSNPQDPNHDWANAIIRQKTLGVIVLFAPIGAQQQSQLRNRNYPFVVLDPAGQSDHDVPSVSSQNWPGGWAAADHLLSLGHRDIAVIGRLGDPLWWRARYSGFVSALEAAGQSIRPECLRFGRFRVEDGLEHGRAILSLPKVPTAIFTGADLQAVGVYEAARELGLRIPEDLSVIGYDDLPVASWLGPPLTTVRQPIAEMAATAVRLVLDQQTSDDQRLALATKLVVRESTAAPR